MARTIATLEMVKGFTSGVNRGTRTHLVAAENLNVRQPNAVCGAWVSNTKRPIHQNELTFVCQKCLKGQQAAFTTFNQPRDCGVCGRKFADSTRRDSNESVCPDCFEKAGYENAHNDGHHAVDQEGFQQDCPACQDEAAADQEQATMSVPEQQLVDAHDAGEHQDNDEDCPKCEDEKWIKMLRNEHEEGFHAGQLVSDCEECQHLEQAQREHRNRVDTMATEHAAGKHAQRRPEWVCRACLQEARQMDVVEQAPVTTVRLSRLSDRLSDREYGREYARHLAKLLAAQPLNARVAIAAERPEVINQSLTIQTADGRKVTIIINVHSR